MNKFQKGDMASSMGTVILVTGDSGVEYFSGVIISAPHDTSRIGLYRDDWNTTVWKTHRDPVTVTVPAARPGMTFGDDHGFMFTVLKVRGAVADGIVTREGSASFQLGEQVEMTLDYYTRKVI